ncbi:MAG: polyamine aminopropyltransferase, partial [Acidobacteriota bacterium]
GPGQRACASPRWAGAGARGRLKQAGRQIMPDLRNSEEFLIEWLNADSGVVFRRGKLVESVATPYQKLEVFEMPQLGRMFRLDGCNMTSERDEFFYHESLVHPAAVAHESPRSALVVGGGDGGSIEELFKHPTIERVVMAELDAEVVRVARRYFQSVHRGALDDPRLEIRIGDGFAFLEQSHEQFDLILMDLTDPVGPARALYTTDCFRAANRALRPAGSLSLHLGSPFFQPARFATALRRLREVFAVVRPYFVHIPLYGAHWGMACASQHTDPVLLSAADVDIRLDHRGIAGLQYFNGDVHCAGFALPNFVRALIGSGSGAQGGT